MIPDANHPARRDIDGEQVIQADKVIGRGSGALGGSKSWKPLAEVTESVDLQDDSGDTLRIDITYRLESRPAEVGEVPDVWIHTERRALLTTASGEHAGATIVGQARVCLGLEDTLDPKAAISKASVGADHWAQVYLAEPQQYVNLHGPGGRASLLADGAGNDVLAYDDPLRTLVGLRNILKQQHVAGRGADVAKMHARAVALLAEAQRGRAVLEQAIKDVESYHDRHTVAPVRWLAAAIADWLAENKQHGRDDTEDVRQLRRAHGELLRLIDAAENAKAPRRDQLGDALEAPFRFVERTAKGIVEVGAMAIDAVVLGIDVIGTATGIGTFEYHPISNYGKSIEQSGDGPQAALVKMVNGFADEWSDALERAGNGDYRGLVDVSADTLMMIDGARTGGAALIEKGEVLVAKVGAIAKSARGLASWMPAEAGQIAMAMAEGADAFVAKVRASGMQMATAGGGAPGPGLGGVSAEALAEGAAAAKQAFRAKRLSQAKARGIKTIKGRLGAAKAPDVTEWVTRVEALFDGDGNAVVRFLDRLEARVVDPAPFMRKVDVLIAVRYIAADDLAAVLSSILDARIVDPVAVLDEMEWLSTRPISAEARSMLIRRAAKGQVDLGWVKRTRLTDGEIDLLGKANNTSFVEFEQVSDVPSRRQPGHLADRPPSGQVAGNASAKIRGIAGELVAQEMKLPGGLRLGRRVVADNAGPATDYELYAPDGRIAELEVKAHRPESWKEELDLYEEEAQSGSIDPTKPVARLLRQVEAGRARGRRVYVAISDGTSLRSRQRLFRYLEALGVLDEEVLLLPESEILRVGRTLREHMSIPQTVPSAKGSR